MGISSKSYLVRAIHTWCLDNELTPHILAGTGYDGISVPDEYITDGQILFNLSPRATRDLIINEQAVEFLANFGQKVIKIRLPMESVISIYSYENGEGITFDDEDHLEKFGEVTEDLNTSFNVIETTYDEKEALKEEAGKLKKSKKPTLKIIK